jgi:hypothetical protein
MSECPKFEPLRDFTHLERVQSEISRLRQIDEISDGEPALLDASIEAMEQYRSYCPRRGLKPSPW